jgi:hypothetical protein
MLMPDPKREMMKELQAKGVDPSTAEYLAELFEKSDVGKQIASGERPIRPLGNCAYLGIAPG